MKGENTTPVTNLDNAGCRDEEPDDNFVLKKCLSESRDDEYFHSDQSQAWPNLLESLPDSPVSCDEDHDHDDHDGTIIWSNPTFCSGDDDMSDDNGSAIEADRNSANWYRENVSGRNKTSGQIRDNFSSTASSQFPVKSRLRACRISSTPINISINVTVGGPRECHGAHQASRTPMAFAKNTFSVRRTVPDRGGRFELATAFGAKEEEAMIRAELAREIERSLEVEIREQISKLNRRLEELQAHQKSEIVHQSSAFKGSRDDGRIRADDPGKKFDWVKTLRSGTAETDNQNDVTRRRRPHDWGFRPERSKSEPRRRRLPPKSLHNCNPCKSEDDIAVHLSQMKFSHNRKGNLNHLEQMDKLKMNRGAAAKNGKVMGNIWPADRICDSAGWGFNKAKKVQFLGGQIPD